MDDPAAGPSLALLPECEARTLLGERRLRLRVLRPPYAALGVGELRVLRASECGERLELVAGYERYERLPVVPAAVGR